VKKYYIQTSFFKETKQKRKLFIVQRDIWFRLKKNEEDSKVELEWESWDAMFSFKSAQDQGDVGSATIPR
jgi:hypothetical protein